MKTMLLRIPAVLAMGVLFAAAAAGRPGKAAPPNIVVFLTDDQGWGDLGCYGHPVIKSPHLDRFATEGVRFTQCYSSCGVCSPSRSSILTGRTPYRNGVFRWIPSGSEVHLRTGEITIAELLKERGYSTCHVGKWHLNGHFNRPTQPQPDDHGFDHWMATQNNAAPSHKNPRNFVRNGKEVGELQGFSAPLVVEEGIRWLQEIRDKEKPFFLNVWTHEPHLPIESDPKFMALYDSPDEGIRQHHGNITQLDHAFGMLMKALDEQGLRDNTIVFFTADNGPEGNGTKGRTRGSTGGLRGRKRADYEGGIRVPGIVRWPGRIEPGTVSDVPVMGTDIFVTICDIVGIPVPNDRPIDGASMLPAFEGKPVDRKIPMYWRTHIAPPDCRVAMRIGDWKIVGNEDMSRLQLFDMKNDWKEQKDVSSDNPEKFEELKKKLIQLDAEIKAEGPDWWKNEKPRRRRAPKLPKGVDKTGDFKAVRGATVTKSELGYAVEAEGEGLALRQLDEPIKGRAEFRVSYRTLNAGTVKNAMIAFGDATDNNRLIKAGTAIGMNAHAIFQGGWTSLGSGKVSRGEFEKGRTFEATITVDLGKRTVEAVIDGTTLMSALPDDLKSITHVGYYVKGTRTSFSAIEIEAKE